MSDLAQVLQDTQSQLVFAQKRIAALEQQVADHATNAHLYRDVIDTIADYLCRYTPDLQLTFANQAYCARLGQTAEQLIGRRITEWVPEIEHAAIIRHMETITPQNPVALAIRSFTNLDGTRSWIEWRDMALIDENGHIYAYQAIGRDVSKEHYLRQQVAQQNAILQQSQDLIGLTDLQGRIVFVNQAGAAMLGYDTPQDLIGHFSTELYAASDIQFFEESIRPMLHDGQWYGETRIKRRDGSLVEVSQTMFLIREDGRPAYHASIMRDITEQKRAQQELRQSQERFSRMFDLLPMGIVVNDRETRHFIEVNDYFLKQTGYSRDELIGHSAVDVGLLEEFAITPEIIAIVDERGVSTGHEITLRQKSGEIRTAILSIVSIELDNKPCAMLAIEDITVQKQIQERLKRSEERFSSIFALMPVSLALIAARDNRYLEVNEAFLSTTGFSREDVIGNIGVLRIQYEPVAEAELQEFYRNPGKIIHLDIDFYNKAGEIRTGYLSIASIELDGQTCFMLAIQDMTSQKQAQRELARLQERFSRTFEVLPLATAIIRQQDHCYLEVNSAFVAMSGYGREEIIGYTCAELGLIEGEVLSMMDNRTSIANQEMIFHSRDGQVRTALLFATMLELDEQRCYLIIIQDITPTREAQTALRQSEERYRKIVETTNEGIWLSDINANTVYVNQRMCQMLGYSAEEMLGRPILDFMEDAEKPAMMQHIDNHRAGFDAQYDFLYQRKDGSDLWASIAGTPYLDADGKPTNLLLMLTDITPRKLQEMALQQSEARQRALIRSMPDLIFRTNAEAVFLDYHTPDHAILAIKPEDFIGKRTTEVLPPEVANRQLLATQQVLETGQVVHFEYTLEIAGAQRSFEARVAPVSADEVLLIVREITERKQADEALRAAHATLEARVRDRTRQLEEVTMQIEAIVNSSGDGIALIDSAYTVQQMNSAFREMFGIEIEQETGYSLMQLTFGEATEALTWILIEVAATGSVRRIELPLKGAAGALIDVEISISRVDLRDHTDHSFVCILRDVSERKRAEVAIAEERNLLRTLIDSMPDYIYAKDIQHHFILANLALAQRFGFDRWEDIIGKTDWDLYSTEQAEKFIAAEDAIFESGMPQLEHEDHVTFESGEQGWLLTNKVALHALSGEMQGLVGITRDISQRKRTEAILDQKYEDERQLHHYLRVMHSIMVELTTVESLDGFYKRAVELALEVLDFDRVALFLYDPVRKYAMCTYAVDRYGKVVHVPDLQFPVGDGGLMQKSLVNPSHIFVTEDSILVDRGEIVGRGWNAGASLWQGDRSIGWIAADNLTRQEPLSSVRLEVIAQYGVLLSSLLARKQVEQALRHSEDLYRSVVTSMTEGIVVHNGDGTIEASNAAAERILGLTMEQMMGRTSLDPRWRSIMEDGSPFPGEKHPAMVTLSTGKPCSNIIMGVHKPDDESITWISINSQPIFRNQSTIPDAVVVTFTDITSHKVAQDALRESESKYRQLIETMGGGVTMSNLQNDLIYANDRFCEIVGLTREQILGQELMRHVVNTDLDQVSDHRLKRQRGESSSYEMTIERPDGKRVTVLVSGSPMYDMNGARSGSFAVSVDITAQKEAEEALRRALEREKELGQLKTQFVSTTSHEFRTPLATILATTETLMHFRNRLDEEQITARLDKIRKQVNHLRQIMDDVLQLARIQARRVEFRPTLGDLHKLCEEIVEEFNSGTENHDRVRYYAPNDEITMVFDPRLMRQVVNNLVSNALKYSEKDKKVDLRLSREGEQVIIVVRDHGIGFPPESMPHLFEPFHRANNVGTIPGTGLGLPIVKESVEIHGGNITLESELGEGSILTVRLPFRDTLPEEDDADDEGNDA